MSEGFWSAALRCIFSLRFLVVVAGSDLFCCLVVLGVLIGAGLGGTFVSLFVVGSRSVMFPRIGLINDPRACCRFTRRVPVDLK
jgi:hypothetical protein